MFPRGDATRGLFARATGARWDGRAHTQLWPAHPSTRGSYYRPGRCTRFGGAEGEPEGAVRFCGEHTTQDHQGYLNGGVFTGRRAASEVLDER